MQLKKIFLILSCAVLLTFLKATAQEKISLRDVEKYVGKEVTVNFQVNDFDSKADHIYLYAGFRYPKQDLTIIVKRPLEIKMDVLLGRLMGGFTGMIVRYSGKPDSSADYNMDSIKAEANRDRPMLIGGVEMNAHIVYTPHNHPVDLEGKLVMLITEQKQISKKTPAVKVHLY